MHRRQGENMNGLILYMRELNMISVLFRLTLAMLVGGILGMERGRKRRPAGFRTYMLVCIGAALTMLISQYEYLMLSTEWSGLSAETGIHMDIARLGAQVINGIGFLAAGTILVTGRHVTGLTTAAGLWASACVGLAIGAGFYECAFLCVLLISLSMWMLPGIEKALVTRAKFVNIYVEFDSLDDFGAIIGMIKAHDARINDVAFNNPEGQKPYAVFYIRLKDTHSRVRILEAVSRLDSVCTIKAF